MAGDSLPNSLSIQGTSATDGGQGFAGINLGTIHYASHEAYSGTVPGPTLNGMPVADSTFPQLRLNKQPSNVTEPSSSPIPKKTERK